MDRRAIALSLLPGVGCVAFREAVERHGAAADAFEFAGTAAERDAALRRADVILARARTVEGAVLVFGERGYPDALSDLPDAPGVVYAIGDPAYLARRRVGIVGTRQASPSGERLARALAGLVARAGAVVVSGMAFGIDAAAHHGALDAGGGTIAVLGGGADVPYPPAHLALHERIARDGLVLSEAPLGARPGKGAFPRRNRIIAALSEVLVVVEAGARSGALITAGQAADLGRVVAALPGPVDSPRHAGSNLLLAEGAQFISRLDDVLSLAGLTAGSSARPPARVAPSAGEDTLAAVVEALRRGVSDVDALSEQAGLAPRQVAAALSALELDGRLTVTAAGQVALAGLNPP